MNCEFEPIPQYIKHVYVVYYHKFVYLTEMKIYQIKYQLLMKSWKCLLVTHTSRCDFPFLVITLLKDTFIKISWCLLTNTHRITCLKTPS